MERAVLLPELLAGVAEGDLIELPGLMVGLDPNPSLCLKVLDVNPGVDYVFEARYMGVNLGQVCLIQRNDVWSLEEL